MNYNIMIFGANTSKPSTNMPLPGLADPNYLKSIIVHRQSRHACLIRHSFGTLFFVDS